MNLLNKLTIKNLKLNKKRTIVTIIGIMLSVALITAVADMFFSARASLIKFEISKYGDYHYAFSNVKGDDLKYFTENRYVESIYLTKNVGYAKLEESKNAYKPYIFIKGFTKDSLDKLGINIVRGRMPENDSEILIPTHLRTNGRVEYKVGDKLTLDVGKRMSEGYELSQDNIFNDEIPETIEDTITKEYTIVGIVERPSTAIEPYSSPGFTFITIVDENNLIGNFDVYVRYNKEGSKNFYRTTANILGVNPDIYENYYHNTAPLSEEDIIKMNEEINKAKYEIIANNNYLLTLEGNWFGDSSTQSLAVVGLVVCVIIIFTSVFCIKNSFDISITEKTKQYGMLSSIGATKKQIKRNVYYEALVLGVIGIFLGILCGLFASYILIIICNILIKGIRNLDLVFVMSWPAIIFAIILGLLTIYLSAWRSAHRAAKINPIEAIRNSEDIKIKANKVKSPKIINSLFGIGGTISYKNIKRNKKKYRTTIISIIVCVAVFIALFSFINLAFKAVQLEVGTHDYNISLNYYLNNEDERKIFNEVPRLDNVDRYAIIRN